jgi:uncharacterized membrane protein YbhN (UPF0104 family)
MYFCLFSMASTANLTLADCLIVFVFGTIGVMLPTPGAGAGAYHFFVMQALLLFGISQNQGLAYATLVHGAQMVSLIVLGLVASLLVFLKTKGNVNS